MEYTMKEKFIDAVTVSYNKSQVCRIMGWHCNGTGLRKVSSWIKEFDIDISHFCRGQHQRIYPLSEKECPVCNEMFLISIGSPKEKQTCSCACSNTLFRSGKDNPNYKEPGTHNSPLSYRSLCFTKHEHKCLLCDWDISVDVHHIDGDHDNNHVDNLVPLCANHHRMAHMTKYKDKIRDKIRDKISLACRV